MGHRPHLRSLTYIRLDRPHTVHSLSSPSISETSSGFPSLSASSTRLFDMSTTPKLMRRRGGDRKLTPEELERLVELIKEREREEARLLSYDVRPRGRKSILGPSAKPRGIFFGLAIGIPVFLWEMMVFMLIGCLLFFVTVIQVVLLGLATVFLLYVLAAHYTGFSVVEFRSSRLEGL